MAVQDIPIEDMDFKQLRAKVQEQEDTIARLKRTFEDAILNIDFDNFSGTFRKEAENFRSEFSMTAKEIKMSVSALDGNLAELSIRADKISSRVTKSINLEFVSSEDPNERVDLTEEQRGMLCLYNDTYYYYDNFEEKWLPYTEGGLTTYFEQRGDIFYLKGNVKVDGNTWIEGNVKARRLYSPDYDNYYAKVYSNQGDFGLYHEDAPENASPLSESCVWGIYNGGLNVSMYANGEEYLTYGLVSNKVFPKGNWDFSLCNVNWGSNNFTAVFA